MLTFGQTAANDWNEPNLPNATLCLNECFFPKNKVGSVRDQRIWVQIV